jgi:hypothetical protein
MLDVQGAGTDSFGVPGFNEVVGHFKNTESGHSAVSLDANADQDAILYFSENGAPRWSIRTDVSDDVNDNDKNALEFRDQMDGYNYAPFRIRRWYGYYRATIDADFIPSVAGFRNCGRWDYYWHNVYAEGFVTADDKNKAKSLKSIEFGLEKILLTAPLCLAKSEGGKTVNSFGFDPKSLVKILPESVFIPENPEENWGIKYNQIIPVLVKAIQEQQEQIETLKNQVAALQD